MINYFRSHVVIEKHIDMLSLPPEYSLAYCVATDFYMVADVPHAFKYDVLALLFIHKL